MKKKLKNGDRVMAKIPVLLAPQAGVAKHQIGETGFWSVWLDSGSVWDVRESDIVREAP